MNPWIFPASRQSAICCWFYFALTYCNILSLLCFIPKVSKLPQRHDKNLVVLWNGQKTAVLTLRKLSTGVLRGFSSSGSLRGNLSGNGRASHSSGIWCSRPEQSPWWTWCRWCQISWGPGPTSYWTEEKRLIVSTCRSWSPLDRPIWNHDRRRGSKGHYRAWWSES